MRTLQSNFKLSVILSLLLTMGSVVAQTKPASSMKVVSDLEKIISVLKQESNEDRIYQAAKTFENIKLSSTSAEKQKEIESALVLLAVLLPLDHSGGTQEFFPVLYRQDPKSFAKALESSAREEIRKNKTALRAFLQEVAASKNATGNG